MQGRRRVHFVLSTHWDREWRLGFQQFRWALVQLFDHVIEGLESGRLLTPFVTDGQSILVDDYLEIRPERRAAVAKLIASGKLVIGPWWTMPDEFLVSGESLIRNLRLGREHARRFGGEPSSVGYVCDIFGHNSQLPQILAGFGIGGAFIWRGVNLIGARQLSWTGADGTMLPCYRFGPNGYGDYAIFVRGGFDYGWTYEGIEDYLEMFVAGEVAASEVAPVLVHDACDHQDWDERAYAALLAYFAANEDRYELVHSTLDVYLEEMINDFSAVTTRLEGELREPGRTPFPPHPRSMAGDTQFVIPGVLSSRVPLKQANARCESLLCQWAEPFSGFAKYAAGFDAAPGFLETAWYSLLANHPHDSIGGCSIDRVHLDMERRFDDAEEIADVVTREATRRIAGSVAVDDHDDRAVRVVLFNPVAAAYDGVAEVELEIPPDWIRFNDFFGYEPKLAFVIHDDAGREVPYQRLSQRSSQRRGRSRRTSLLQTVEYTRVRVAFQAAIPPLGYSTYVVREPAEASSVSQLDSGGGIDGRSVVITRYPQTPGLATSDRSMSNGILDVAVEQDGSLTVFDHRSGQSYSRLLTYEDSADIGDGWFHGPALADAVYSSAGSKTAVALEEDTPLFSRFRVRTTFAVPARFEREARSDELVDLQLDAHITLRVGEAFVEVTLDVENTACDHRLRVLMPTGVDTDSFFSDTPFDVIERPIALRGDNHLYREPEVEGTPQQMWTAVSGGGRGLAVVSTGLYETTVRDQPQRPLGLTLLRAFARTVLTNGEPGGQIQGSHRFHFIIAPLEGHPEWHGLFLLGQRLAGGIRVVQLDHIERALVGDPQLLPPSGSLATIDGAVVLTSVRDVGGALEFRLFNPAERAVEGRILLGEAVVAAQRDDHVVAFVDFESVPRHETTGAGAVALQLAPKEIATVRVAMADVHARPELEW